MKVHEAWVGKGSARGAVCSTLKTNGLGEACLNNNTVIGPIIASCSSQHPGALVVLNWTSYEPLPAKSKWPSEAPFSTYHKYCYCHAPCPCLLPATGSSRPPRPVPRLCLYCPCTCRFLTAAATEMGFTASLHSPSSSARRASSIAFTCTQKPSGEHRRHSLLSAQ